MQPLQPSPAPAPEAGEGEAELVSSAAWHAAAAQQPAAAAPFSPERSESPRQQQQARSSSHGVAGSLARTPGAAPPAQQLLRELRASEHLLQTCMDENRTAAAHIKSLEAALAAANSSLADEAARAQRAGEAAAMRVCTAAAARDELPSA